MLLYQCLRPSSPPDPNTPPNSKRLLYPSRWSEAVRRRVWFHCVSIEESSYGSLSWFRPFCTQAVHYLRTEHASVCPCLSRKVVHNDDHGMISISLVLCAELRPGWFCMQREVRAVCKSKLGLCACVQPEVSPCLCESWGWICVQVDIG